MTHTETAPKGTRNAPETAKSPEEYKTLTEGKKTAENAPQPATNDFKPYYSECAKRLYDDRAQDFLSESRISNETAIKYNIGFDPIAKPAPCIIIPVSDNYYILQSIDDGALYARGAKPEIFNKAVLHAAEVKEIFVTTGIIDALNLIELGYNAIALNGNGNAGKLIQALKKKPTRATVLLSLDDDETGKEAQQKLTDSLKRLNVSCQAADIAGDFNSVNDALRESPQILAATLQGITTQVKRPDSMRYYANAQAQEDKERFKESGAQICFKELNKKAGGIHSGLYIIAAASSLGKTTFALQIADGFAADGKDVIFFSMEQSRLEMFSKSVARIAAKNRIEDGTEPTSADFKGSPCAIAIRSDNLTVAQQKEAYTAQREYIDTISDRMSIIEANMQCNVSYIADYVQRYIDRTGTRPIIFIDYLQILQPSSARRSDKEKIDENVTALKQMARDFNITVFLISALNRGGYYNSVGFESLKESGSIEYTADVVWGLQPDCISEKTSLFNSAAKHEEKKDEIDKAMKKNPRTIELKCQKNRNGAMKFNCKFAYYPACDLYVEEPDEAEEPEIIYKKNIPTL